MRTPRPRAVIALALTLSMTMLTACGSPSGPDADEGLENGSTSGVTDIGPIDTSDESSPSGTGNLSQEARDQGFSEVQLPGGWPSELPLPKGTPVDAMRSGNNFYFVYDLDSVEAGMELLDWYQSTGWSVIDDIELDGVRGMSFGSPETNDYGPLRTVGVTIGMMNWPTGLQYNLTVQDD